MFDDPHHPECLRRMVRAIRKYLVGKSSSPSVLVSICPLKEYEFSGWTVCLPQHKPATRPDRRESADISSGKFSNLADQLNQVTGLKAKQALLSGSGLTGRETILVGPDKSPVPPGPWL
jgi:hypothetical protein